MQQRYLIRFLQEELKLPDAAIALAIRQDQQDSSMLPMILWQYGMVTLVQLAQVFDWLETV